MSIKSSELEVTQHALAADASLSQSTLISVYQKYFEYKVVRTAEEQAAAYRLRYDVYCEETGFLSKLSNSEGMERDEHDSHSIQSLLCHRASGKIAGTVRLVLPRTGVSGCAQPARLSSAMLDQLPQSVLPREASAEISRFAIHPSFRRRLGDGLYARIFTGDDLATGDVDPRRVIPHITLGLFASIFEMAHEKKITHLFAVIDPALLRLLSRLGIHFNKAGGPIEFHGLRQPVYVSGDDLLSRMEAEQPQIFKLITTGTNRL